jgi:hypothetical protein
MALSKTRRKRFAESRFPHERGALEFLSQGLPDSDPNLLYTNFEFIADDGSVNEIDALVITRAGVFLVEIKGRGGVVSGNRHNWDWEKDGLLLELKRVTSPRCLRHVRYPFAISRNHHCEVRASGPAMDKAQRNHGLSA